MSESETILLQRVARTGDAEAFSEIVGRYAAVVYSAAIRVLEDADRAADATQDTFFDLLQHAGEITGSVGGWLHRVATRKAIDRIRRDSARRTREAQYAAGTRHPGIEVRKWQDISPHVDEALDQLDDETRQILIEHFFHAKTMSDIAVSRDISQPTVSRRVEAGLERLRDTLRARGIVVAGAALGGLLAENAVQAAPPAVLAELGKMAMAGSTAAVAGAAGATGAGTAQAAAASVLGGTSAKVIAVAAVVIAGAGGIVTYNRMTHKDEPTPPVAAVVPDNGKTPGVRPAKVGQVDTASMSDEEFERWLFGEGGREQAATAETQTSAAEASGPGPAAAPPMAAGASESPPMYGMGFGGMGMGGTGPGLSFNTPDETVSSFVQVIASGDMTQISQCFVEGADDVEDLRRIMEDPQDAEDVQFQQLLKSIGPPVEITGTVEEQNGLGVTWLSTVQAEFALGDMVFRPGVKFELDATLVQVDGQWKMAGL